MPTRFPFKHHQRLRHRRDFAIVFRSPVVFRQPFWTLLATTNTFSYPRMAVIVSKKKIKSACRRNRLKRIARESFRLNQHLAPAVDAVLIPSQKSLKADNNTLRSQLSACFTKLRASAR